jgi:eukaryotic-like serine/threonine-protein kinase
MLRLSPGQTLSHYRIISQLGQGGQATAYKAEDVRLERPVVIKTLLPELSATASAKRRFEREARLASALDHPNICSVYDVGEIDGLCYIVMQFIDGDTVKTLVRSGRLDDLSGLSIAIQVADALVAAHARGIVHRDIKPTNVIVTPHGKAMVLDFGLAKMLVGDDSVSGRAAVTDESMTGLGMPFGTVGYSSPEQISGDRVDHRTDIFSLGVLLYEMVIGQPPFRGRHQIEVLNAVLNDDPRPLPEFVAKRLPSLQAILGRALAKKPSDRYSSMVAMREHLKLLMREVSQETGLIPTESSATLIAPRRARNAWRLSGTLGRVVSRFRGSSGGPGSHLSASSSKGSSEGSSSSRPASWGTETKKTVAVLPFKNLSGDSSADFYEFSLADAIITELAHLRTLIVRPSSYIAAYSGQSVDPQQIGEALAVGWVLTGNFIKTGSRLRVTAQLVATGTGEILWCDKIDVAERDLLTIQDAIAERVIKGLQLNLTEGERERIDRPLTNSSEAYESYLRGRNLLFRFLTQTFDDGDLDLAIKMFAEAVSLDDSFARAHAGLGRCYVHHAQGYGGHHYYELAERSLSRALEIDPGLTGARLQMVYVYLHRGEKEQALATLADARREAPNDPTVLITAAMLYRLDGLYDKALKQYDRLLELNPRDVVVASYGRARIFNYEHEYEKAIAELNRGREVEPEHPLIKTFLAVAYFDQGRIVEARNVVEDVLNQHPHFDGVQVLLAWCLSAQGEHDRARSLINDAVIETAAADHDISLWLASFYAMEGMRDEGIDWVRRAIKLGNENYPLFQNSRKLDGLRGDPRFEAILRELKEKWEQRV